MLRHKVPIRYFTFDCWNSDNLPNHKLVSKRRFTERRFGELSLTVVLGWPEKTFFFQEKLVCVYPEDSIPCQDAHYYYMINENFGKQVWHTTPRSLEEEKRNLG